MNELALFAGGGGGILGGILIGWRTVCAVELDGYCRKILLARQRDGHLPKFPIWDDVRTFDGGPWRGHVDVISGGFPCQAFSTAARGRNVAVDLWPEMLRIIGEVEPGYVFAENVGRKPIQRAEIDLRRRGYTTNARRLCSSRLGSPHRRPRWWMVAHADGEGESRCGIDAEVAGVCEISRLDWWEDEPSDLGVANGMAFRVDRLRALGNGQVPGVAAAAWRILTKED